MVEEFEFQICTHVHASGLKPLFGRGDDVARSVQPGYHRAAGKKQQAVHMRVTDHVFFTHTRRQRELSLQPTATDKNAGARAPTLVQNTVHMPG